jgi:hypothetical protein
MSFSPNLFLANINAKEGLAKPSRFEVILPIPQYINQYVGNSVIEKILNLPNTLIADISDIVRGSQTDTQSRSDNPSMSRYLALQCESAELPGKSLITADAKVYGPTFKVPYQTQYTDTTLSFLCTNEFYERKLFEKWMESIMPPDTNNLRFPKGDNSRYLTNIKIIQYDEFIRQIFAIELMDAFPIGIAPQPLSWQEDNFHRLGVQFAYQKYRVLYSGNYDLVQAATSLFGTKITSFFNRVPSALSQPVGSIFNLIT